MGNFNKHQKEELISISIIGSVIITIAIVIVAALSLMPERKQRNPLVIRLPKAESVGESVGDKSTRFTQGFFRGIKKNFVNKKENE